jgi:hopanoid biosynthesis associated RND transporter like protein HpnN
MTAPQVPPAGASPVRRLLATLVALVCRCPRLVLALSLLACALSVYSAATRLQYHTRRDDLISAHKECRQRWQQYLGEFGDDDDIVVVVKGADRPRMEQALDAVADRVRARADLFDRLFYKLDLRHLRDRALLLLPLEQLRTIQGDYLGDMGRLLESGPAGWMGLGLLTLTQEANARVGKLQAGAPLSRADDCFLSQLLAVSRAARATLADPAAYRDPWGSLMKAPPEQQDLLDRPLYFFSGSRPANLTSPGAAAGATDSLAFLLMRPVKEAGSFTAALRSVAAARAIVADVQAQFAGLEMGLTGLPVLETDEMVAAEHDTRLASWLAIAGVCALFLIVYRGIAYPLLTVTTLLVGTAWALGWLTLTVGHLNILSATFAVMLIGMGDYGVLWVMRYEQARRHGADVRTALLHTTTHVAVGNLTAASTLALAFFAAILADFKAVAELGWIAGCGVLLCAFACFTVLPALLMLFDRRGQCGVRLADCGFPTPSLPRDEPPPWLLPFTPHSALRTPQSKDVWLPRLGRRAGWVLGGALALAVALAACTRGLSYDHNLLHLQAKDLESVKWERTLIAHTAGASWHALSYTDSRAEALQRKARFEKLPGVERVVEAASLVPPDQQEKLPLLADIRKRLHSLPRRGAPIAHPVPDFEQVLGEVADLVARLRPLAKVCARTDLLARLHASLHAFHGQLRAVPDVAAAQLRLRDFDRRLAEDLAENLHRLREVSTPRPIALAELPLPLRERYVGRTGKWLLRVFAKAPPEDPDRLWDLGPLEEFTRQVHSVDPGATGKPFTTVEGLKAMKNGLQRAGLYAFAVIALVLWLDFRNLRHTLLALTPLALGVLLSLGVLGLLGMPLNPANMIAFPLILGVGVDNGVHVLHDHLIRRREGRAGVSRAIGRGVLVKALTTMIGFGTLLLSTERGLVGLGFILTLGVGCSMLAALLVLPALLQVLGQRREVEQARWVVQEPVRSAA